MTTKSTDLDISNYNLQEILEIFKIYDSDFTETDLKRAKQMVLKTHPDKSKLPPEYFIFFSKAYKTLFSIWEFRSKSERSPSNENTDYISATLNHSEEEKRELLDTFFDSNKKLKKTKDFNNWFNKEFEKNRLISETQEKGYGDWLKSEEEQPAFKTSEANMASDFERLKREARSLTVYQDVQEIDSYGGSLNSSELSLNAPQHFNSDLFSPLQYQDLQKAHTETVIPVTEEDYENTQKFNNVNEFMAHRNAQTHNMKPLSEQQALDYLKNRDKKEDQNAVRRAYDLAKQTEEAQRRQQGFWSNIKLLHNK
uniref:J domain-containing protein n=1 Tax=viral metagenome TaxID=1070528 RepID=A0A6C0KWK6_9ZZZZ